MLVAVLIGMLALSSAIVAAVAVPMTRGLEPYFQAARPLAPVARLRPAVTPPQAPPLPSLPVGFRYDAVMPGPLQLVDDYAPTTKVCPECDEAVLASARVCKHCQHRFAPPLRGSRAV
jgi:Uncharacterised protein family UPF0547